MSQHTSDDVEAVVLSRALTEWESVRQHLPDGLYQPSPFGEWRCDNPDVGSVKRRIVWFNGGCGKIAAAASAQYAIDLWRPRLLVNLGTCGGIEWAVKQDNTILVERTVVYDIREEMGQYRPGDCTLLHTA